MTQVSGPGPSFRIGSSGSMSNARVANPVTQNWATALSEIGGAWARARGKELSAQANRAKAAQQIDKRKGWAQQLSGGSTLRDLVQSDPTVLADSGFLKFWNDSRPAAKFEDILDAEGRAIGQRGPDGRVVAHPLAPAPEQPEAETWNIIENPYGRGGSAQKSSVSGKLSGYLAPQAQEPQRERKTAKDRFGRLRYLDDQTPAFSDETLGPEQEATKPEVPLKDRLQMARQLSDDWQKTVRPMQNILASSDRMQIGLDMAQAGDMLAGSQAILISFNKLLDPTSVVRESEYARSATGQSAIETLRGYADKLARGGAGVTLEELASYKRFGEEVVRRALESTVAPERDRITRLAKYAGVDEQLIFTGRFKPQGDQQGAAALPGQPAQGQAMGLPEAAAPGLPQENALARSLPAPAPAPASPAPGAGQGQEVDAERVKMYLSVPPDVLARQVQDMSEALLADPKSYPQAEIDAAKRAYDIAFPGGK